MKWFAIAWVIYAGGVEHDVRQWFRDEVECKTYVRSDLCRYHPNSEFVFGVCMSEGQYATGPERALEEHFEVWNCQK